MTLILYFACFFIALVGSIIQTAVKINSLKKKAAAANVIFKTQDYFEQDFWAIVAGLFTIILFLMLVDVVLKVKPAYIDYVKPAFAFIGYVGSDAASRLFGVISDKINDVINIKSNKADGTSDPTTTLK